MAESDRVSQIESAQRLGHKEGIEEGKILGKKEGELVKLIMLIQKKMSRGDTKEKIADDLMEEENLINPIYQLVKQNPDKTEEEIYKMLDL